jgi:hypothetical protein
MACNCIIFITNHIKIQTSVLYVKCGDEHMDRHNHPCMCTVHSMYSNQNMVNIFLSSKACNNCALKSPRTGPYAITISVKF